MRKLLGRRWSASARVAELQKKVLDVEFFSIELKLCVRSREWNEWVTTHSKRRLENLVTESRALE